MSAILSSPENESLSAEEVAERCIDALDTIRARSHRLLVVGQIEYPQAPGTAYTVALGPFSARGTLDSPEKFAKATQGGSAAREAGQGLAWDSKTGKGRGRFMMVPAFRSARDAWNYFRDSVPALAEEDWADLSETITREIVPVCVCGMKATLCRWCNKPAEHWCHRHLKGAQHRCGAAAA